jgi:hypothetical protein
MAKFNGKGLIVNWIYSGGTVVLSGNSTQFTFNQSGALYEATAGADAAKNFVTGELDSSASLAARHEAGGTALYNALLANTAGTLIIAPEGTAATKQKITMPAISQGAGLNIPYNNVVDLSCSWQGNGTVTYGAY